MESKHVVPLAIRSWPLMMAVMLIIVSGTSRAQQAAAQADCSIQYLLDHDLNYYSEGSTPMAEECRKRLIDELSRKADSDNTERYVLLQLQALRRLSPEVIDGYIKLCEVDHFPRACS